MSTHLAAAAWCLTPGCTWTIHPTDPDDVDTRARRHSGDGLTGGPHPAHTTITSTWPTHGRDGDDAEHQRAGAALQRTLTRWLSPTSALTPEQ